MIRVTPKMDLNVGEIGSIFYAKTSSPHDKDSGGIVTCIFAQIFDRVMTLD